MTKTAVIQIYRNFLHAWKTADNFTDQFLTLWMKNQEKDKADHRGQKNKEGSRIAAKCFADSKKGTGDPAHFHSKLAENLAENRENLYKKNYNNRSHHAQHNKGIGDCTLDLVCDLNLLRIESRQTLHNLIQTAGLFAGADIGSSRSRKSTGLFHGVRQRAGFLHVFIKKGQNFFAPFCLAVVI